MLTDDEDAPLTDDEDVHVPLLTDDKDEAFDKEELRDQISRFPEEYANLLTLPAINDQELRAHAV